MFIIYLFQNSFYYIFDKSLETKYYEFKNCYTHQRKWNIR